MKAKHLLLSVKSLRGSQHMHGVIVHNILLDACHAAKAHVVGVAKHTFHPQGFSSVIILAESHASIHTWPEEEIAKIDYFSCADEPNFEAFARVWEENGFKVESASEVSR